VIRHPHERSSLGPEASCVFAFVRRDKLERVRWFGPLAPWFFACGSFAGALVACDTAEDPLPPSIFPDPFPSSSQLVGHVWAGTEPAGGALVRVDPSPGFPADPRLLAASDSDPRFARSTTTDAAGAYRLQFAPFVYDLALTRGPDLYVFHDLVTRAFEPPFAIEAAVAGFSARLVPSTNPPPRAGDATAYFLSGDDARAIAEVTSAAGTFDAKFRHFESTVTLHAIEYVAAEGLASAVAEGKIDVRVRDGVVVTPVVAMTPITLPGMATFSVTPPPGYVLDAIAMEMDFGLRTSAAPLPLTHIVPGQPLKLAVATDARYFVRARAKQGAAVSDSGRFYLNPFADNALVLPPPVSTEAPIDDQIPPLGEGTMTPPGELAAGGTLAARLTKGIVEHALRAESGSGTTIHVVTGERATTLPDPRALGLVAPTGRYLWTVQSFPTLAFTDRFTGQDARVSPPSWTSAPRVIVLR
jgi:hypothetical protein